MSKQSDQADIAQPVTQAPAVASRPSTAMTSNTGGDTVCSTPGNVQINDSPSVDEFSLPYWDEVWGGAYQGPYQVPYAEGSGEIGGPHGR